MIPLKRFDPDLDRLFAFGIDREPGRAPTDQPSDWPEVARVRDYCDRVRDSVDNIWNSIPSEMQQVCIEHRLMHAETLAYLLHNMDHYRLITQGEESVDDTEIEGGRVEIPAGMATLGKRSGEGFGWDNEFEQCTEQVECFSIGRSKVTNREYLKFVEAGAPRRTSGAGRMASGSYAGCSTSCRCPPIGPSGSRRRKRRNTPSGQARLFQLKLSGIAAPTAHSMARSGSTHGGTSLLLHVRMAISTGTSGMRLLLGVTRRGRARSAYTTFSGTDGNGRAPPLRLFRAFVRSRSTLGIRPTSLTVDIMS